jgi:DNA repair protein RecN (Recombination protein N)
MLERIQVRGLGIIDEVELELDPGFAVLTGETGAGKSLLVESLKLVAGQRAQPDLVRTGDERLRVEGWFTVVADPELAALLEELGAPGGEALVIRREVASTGRGRCWINDTPVTAAALQRLAPLLLAIHGQHEQHGLAEPAIQRRLVDDFGGLAEVVARVGAAFRDWREASFEVARLREAHERRRDRLDVIAFQLAEIAAADPRSGEDRDLEVRRQLLRHAVQILELATRALSRLTDDEGAAVDALAAAERDLSAIADCGVPLADAAVRLAEARVQAEEVAREVRDLVEGVEEDPAELEAVEARLHRLERLMLKYGSPIDAVLEHRERIEAERAELEQVTDRLAAAERNAGAALAAYDAQARELDRARRAAGQALAEAVQGVLARLNMAGTRLEFEWRPRSDERSPLERDGAPVAFDGDGVEECELRIAANPGEEPRPMARIASGGELSRLHLALRTVLLGRRVGRPLTLLFDEVDSGLGGATAAALAELLADLASEHQVVVITHLPQVAAGASSHVRVEKVLAGGRAVTRATRLDRRQREEEVARMLAGGEVTASARAHARQLLGGR